MLTITTRHRPATDLSYLLGIAERHGYFVRFLPIGPLNEVLWAPTQMAVFERAGVGHG